MNTLKYICPVLSYPRDMQRGYRHFALLHVLNPTLIVHIDPMRLLTMLNILTYSLRLLFVLFSVRRHLCAGSLAVVVIRCRSLRMYRQKVSSVFRSTFSRPWRKSRDVIQFDYLCWRNSNTDIGNKADVVSRWNGSLFGRTAGLLRQPL